MKTNKFVFILVLWMAFLSGHAQRTSNLQFDLGLVQNHKGFFKLFNGIAEVGAGYNRELARNFYAGAHLRLSVLSRSGTTNRLAIYKPGLNLHYFISLTEQFAIIPVISAGYSFLSISNKEYGYREMQSGFNPGAGLRFLWMRQRKIDFYLFGRFDYIYLDEDVEFTRMGYYRQIYMTAFGIGIRIKSGSE